MKKMPLQLPEPLIRTILASGLVTGLAMTLGISAAQGLSVKSDPIAAKGCIPKVSMAASIAVMKRFNLHEINARPAEIQTLGTALTWIEKLNGGKPPLRARGSGEGYSYNFQSRIGNSQQQPNQIRVNRNGTKRYGENVAQLVHELGHYIGNNGGYEAYREAVGRHFCVVSSYSDDKFHEQFAEVFAAFVTRPAKIRKNPSLACRRAYKFFANLFDGPAMALTNQCMIRQSAIEKAMNTASKGKAAANASSTQASN